MTNIPIIPIPTSQDYVAAVTNLSRFILDSALKTGLPRKSSIGLELYSGGFSRVFPINVGNKILALRCWTASVEDAEKRYQEISKYLKLHHLPYFVDFEYVEKGISVNKSVWPIIRMEWVTGLTLKDYIEKNLYAPYVILELAETFLKMVTDLHAKQIAHGDLQDGNIIVINSKQIKLIDYDSLFVPTLAGYDDQIVGIPSYQHPKRIKPHVIAKTSEKIDYFSELVIYLSLLALVEKPGLWQEFNIPTAEGLIFSKDDFLNPSKAKSFKELRKLSKDVVFLTNKLEEFCNQKSIDNLIPLEKVLSENKQAKLGSIIGQLPKTQPVPPSVTPTTANVSSITNQIPVTQPPSPPVVPTTANVSSITNQIPVAQPTQPPVTPTSTNVSVLMNQIPVTQPTAQTQVNVDSITKQIPITQPTPPPNTSTPTISANTQVNTLKNSIPTTQVTPQPNNPTSNPTGKLNLADLIKTNSSSQSSNIASPVTQPNTPVTQPVTPITQSVTPVTQPIVTPQNLSNLVQSVSGANTTSSLALPTNPLQTSIFQDQQSISNQKKKNTNP